MNVTVLARNAANTSTAATLADAFDVEWYDPRNDGGYGTISVPASSPDAAYITWRRVIKIVPSWATGRPFAFMVNKYRKVLQDDGSYIITATGPDLCSAWMGQAIVYPEFGIYRPLSGRRYFNFAAEADAWHVATEWDASTGFAWGDMDPKSPVEFPDPVAEWLAPDPVGEYGGSTWFRVELSLEGSVPVRVYFAADDDVTLWVDGEPKVSADGVDSVSRMKALRTTEMVLTGVDDPHTHVIAAEVKDSTQWAGELRVGEFILTMYEIDEDGEHVGSPITRTTPETWEARTDADDQGRPGWYPGQVSKRLHAEGVAREASGYEYDGTTYTTLGFDDDDDSNGTPWAERTEISFPILITQAEALYQLAEHTESDVWLDYETNVLEHAQRRGADLSGTVALEPGVNLLEWSSEILAPQANIIVAQTVDGYRTAISPGGVPGMGGGVARPVQLGGSPSSDEGFRQAQGILAEEVSTRETISIAFEPTPGAMPLDDFDLGDTIATPGYDGESAEVRVQAFRFRQLADKVTCELQVAVEV